MPDRPPSEFESESDWTSYCVPFMMDEGMPNKQAVAACLQMWRDRDKKAVPPLADRAWSTLAIKSVDAEQRTIEGIASTPEVDRIGDIVEPLGAQFKMPMPLLWMHKHDMPVGHVLVAKAAKDGITIKAQIARIEEPGELKNLVDKAWQAVRAGLVRGLSIGFKPIQKEVELLENGGLRFNKWSWFETSLVTIPANASATISVVKSIDQGLPAASGQKETSVKGQSGDVRGGRRPGGSGKASVNLKPKDRTMPKTIAEQIEALEAKRAANDDRMNEIMAAAMDEGRSTDEAEREEFDNLERENETVQGDLKRFKALERANVAKAQPLQQVKTVEDGSAARAGMIRVRDPELPKGIRFARVARCLGLAQGNRFEALRIGQKAYASDQPTLAMLEASVNYGEVSDLAVKAAVPAGTTLDPGWAGNLVAAAAGEAGVVSDFLEFLRPQTIVGKFGTGGIPSLRRVPFRTGLVTQTQGGTGYWVGEGAAKPVTKVDFNRRTLTPTKVANIAVVTEELLRDSSPSADGILRDSLAAALTARIDSDFIDPAITASGARPASITNAATVTTSTGGGTYGSADQIRQDVRAMMANFIAANNPPSQGVWIMRATTALALSLMQNPLGQAEFGNITVNGGSFVGFPVIVSEYVPAIGSPSGDYVVFVNASQIWFADEGGISIDMSREASIAMDDAPTGAAGSGSPSGVTGLATTSLVSLWQENCVGFRAERTLNWAVARASAVQVLAGVNWGEGTEP